METPVSTGATIADVVLPELLNHRGTLFSRAAIALMDRDAFVTDPTLGFCENFFHMCFGEVPATGVLRCFEISMILYAEHSSTSRPGPRTTSRASTSPRSHRCSSPPASSAVGQGRGSGRIRGDSPRCGGWPRPWRCRSRRGRRPRTRPRRRSAITAMPQPRRWSARNPRMIGRPICTKRFVHIDSPVGVGHLTAAIGDGAEATERVTRLRRPSRMRDHRGRP